MRVTNLDMDALRSFVTGMELGSFARAADRLGRSTSAISAQLKKLEEQAGVSLVRKSGRGLVPTASGEQLLSYGRRILDLNDEAVAAVKGVDLDGWVRLGLQEDFGDALLPQVLGRFARSHPRVSIEGRIARNSELIERVTSGDLDLAIAWDGGETVPFARRIAEVPLCWLGAADLDADWRTDRDGPVALAALDAPCLFRSVACDRPGPAGAGHGRMAFREPGSCRSWRRCFPLGSGSPCAHRLACRRGPEFWRRAAHNLPRVAVTRVDASPRRKDLEPDRGISGIGVVRNPGRHSAGRLPARGVKTGRGRLIPRLRLPSASACRRRFRPSATVSSIACSMSLR